MPAKLTVRALLRKHLGKEAGDAMAAKIDKMVSENKSSAQIEEAFKANLTAHFEKRATVASKEFKICLGRGPGPFETNLSDVPAPSRCRK